MYLHDGNLERRQQLMKTGARNGETPGRGYSRRRKSRRSEMSDKQQNGVRASAQGSIFIGRQTLVAILSVLAGGGLVTGVDLLSRLHDNHSAGIQLVECRAAHDILAGDIDRFREGWSKLTEIPACGSVAESINVPVYDNIADPRGAFK